MGLRGITPFIVPQSSSAKRLSQLTAAALRKGFKLSKECGYIYTLKAASTDKLLLESLDLDAVEAAINSTASASSWDKRYVRFAICDMRIKKEDAKHEQERNH